MNKQPRDKVNVMPDRAFLFLFLLLLTPACTCTQPTRTIPLVLQLQEVGDIPFGAEFQAPEETLPSLVQLASLSPVSLPQEIPVLSQPTPARPVQTEQYRIRNGDVVSVKFIKNPELDVTTAIHPDGTIFLPLVGEIMAKGLTLPELRTVLSQRYKDFIERTGYGEVLREGDFFELHFAYDPELNVGVRIRSDGKISLPLLGEIQAAGLRPSELYQQLLEGYRKHLSEPDLVLLVGPDTAKKIFTDEAFISFALAKTAEQKIFVGGEVRIPRVIEFEGQISVLQAIMQAGGAKETGDLSRVVVLRRGQFEQASWIQTDLSNPLSGKSIENDLTLYNGDVVVVPMTGIAKVDLFVKQYIHSMLPFQRDFYISIVPPDTRH